VVLVGFEPRHRPHSVRLTQTLGNRGIPLSHLPLGSGEFRSGGCRCRARAVIRLLRTQDSVPSLNEHVTVRRSRDSPTPSGSRVLLGKQSPDWSRDQVTLPVQTQSREDARRVHNAKITKQPSMAKDKNVGRIPRALHGSHSRGKISAEHHVAS
jgi:hypothetical protein